VPFFRSCIARSTFFDAFLLYVAMRDPFDVAYTRVMHGVDEGGDPGFVSGRSSSRRGHA
jgi:hypothetical protein